MRKWLKPGVQLLSAVAPLLAINVRCEAREETLVLQSQPDRASTSVRSPSNQWILHWLPSIPSVMSNMPSARLHPRVPVVSDYFKEELDLGQLLSLFPPSSAIVSSL